MPRLAVFIPARDEREDGLIFKRHMWLAYSKSADELGEAVAEQSVAATTDLPLPAYHLLLLCLAMRVLENDGWPIVSFVSAKFANMR